MSQETVFVVGEDGVAKQMTAGLAVFNPAQPGNFGLPTPSNVQDALDDLADTSSSNTHFNAAILAAAASILLTSPAVTPVRSGRFLVTVNISATATVAGTFTCNLQADGATQASSQMVTGGGGLVFLSATQIVNLSRIVSHTFGVQLVASAGTVTAAVGFARINVVELP